MRRFVITCLTLVAAALLVLPAAATAATSKASASAPQITRVQPMRISVGGTLTVTGQRYKSIRRRKTVIFRATD